jgi:YVTN family beta-propeller protein
MRFLTCPRSKVGTIASTTKKPATWRSVRKHFRFASTFVACEASENFSRFSIFLQLVLFSVGLVCTQAACAQDWQWIKTINVGTAPERAVLLPNSRELYVSNRASCNVSVIDTEKNERVASVTLGKSPKAMVASHDGQRVYVLLEKSQSCPGEPTTNVAKGGHSLAIITTIGRSVTYVALPGERWDELAVTRDGRLYMTEVVDGEQRFFGAVYIFDTEKNELGNMPVIQEAGCPVGIAISNDEQRLYVNYQCGGPGVSPGVLAHDSIGVYELSSHKLIHVITGLPNVGGRLALSGDGSQLWAEGNDACSRPSYPHTDGCPGFPVSVVNAIRTSDLEVLSYGLSLEDFNGRISVSPEGEAFVTGGTYLKTIPSRNLKEIRGHSSLVVNRLPIANVGDVAFKRDLKAEYMYATIQDRNVVYVMLRVNNETAEDRDAAEQLPIAIGNPLIQPGGRTHIEFSDTVIVQTHDKPGDAPGYAPVSELSLANVLAILGEHAGYGKCTENNSCIRVLPQAIAPVLRRRGDKRINLDQCGQPEMKAGQPAIKLAEVYRCVANVVLSTAPGEGDGRVQAIDLAMELRALEANEDFMEFRVEYVTKKNEVARLDQKTKSTRLTLEEQQRLDDLRDEVQKFEQDSRAFTDATRRLSNPSALQKSLGSSAVVLGLAVETYALFNLKGELECSGTVYAYGGPLLAKDFQRRPLQTTFDAALQGGCKVLESGPPTSK